MTAEQTFYEMKIRDAEKKSTEKINRLKKELSVSRVDLNDARSLDLAAMDAESLMVLVENLMDQMDVVFKTIDRYF